MSLNIYRNQIEYIVYIYVILTLCVNTFAHMFIYIIQFWINYVQNNINTIVS